VLRYFEAGQRFSTAVQFLGEMTLLHSVWRILGTRGLNVQVDLLPPQGSRHADRRALAALLQSQVHAQLHGESRPS
jgi:1-acyl-sn-glycerol-3-phosphate acyltransferase